LRIFVAKFGVKRCGRPQRTILCFRLAKNFPPKIQHDTESFQNALRSARLTRGGFLRHCLACGRALANCVRRASQLSIIVNQSTANSRTTREAAPAREAFTPGGRAPIRAVFISASEDQP
jgi:hypothetical protein